MGNLNLIERLKEPSTYASIAAIVAFFSISAAEMIPQIGENIAAIVVAVTGILGVVRSEGG